jgi:hypothetical protein
MNLAKNLEFDALDGRKEGEKKISIIKLGKDISEQANSLK